MTGPDLARRLIRGKVALYRQDIGLGTAGMVFSFPKRQAFRLVSSTNVGEYI